MTVDVQWALQQAVYSALRADATLKSLVSDPVRVYDHVPQDTTFPYVVIGEMTALSWDTKTTEGMEVTLTIHTWSRHAGLKETKQIMSAIVDALDQVSLSVTGFTTVLLRFEFSDTFHDPDGVTRHGVQRFRALEESS